LDVSLIDEVVEVTDDDAILTARNLAKVQGILAGTSSGANVWASMKMAEKFGEGNHIVTILPDRVERYFSTSLI
jgi:cysteine synthase A